MCYNRNRGDDMEILFSDKDIVVCVKPVGMDAEHAVPEALKAELGL